jgi:hypothetical protein
VQVTRPPARSSTFFLGRYFLCDAIRNSKSSFAAANSHDRAVFETPSPM